MKLLTLDGKEVAVSFQPKESTNPSIPHLECRELLQQHYFRDIIVEEFNIPGSRYHLDFFIPKKMIAYEVDPAGSHHDKHNPFFHGNIANKNFAGQVKRDVKKDYWCQINSIQLVRIKSKAELEEILSKL
jgi:hypothetical protein